jgi:hypothetical protein
MGAGGGAAWAVPAVRPRVPAATPPAARAPVHRRSHGLVRFLSVIFMPAEFPSGMGPKHLPRFRPTSNAVLKCGTAAAYLALRGPCRDLAFPAQPRLRAARNRDYAERSMCWPGRFQKLGLTRALNILHFRDRGRAISMSAPGQLGRRLNPSPGKAVAITVAPRWFILNATLGLPTWAARQQGSRDDEVGLRREGGCRHCGR